MVAKNPKYAILIIIFSFLIIGVAIMSSGSFEHVMFTMGSVETRINDSYSLKYKYMNGQEEFDFSVDEGLETLIIETDMKSEKGELVVEIYDNQDTLLFSLENIDNNAIVSRNVEIPTNGIYDYTLVIRGLESKNGMVKLKWYGK